jgi:transcriptional regulator with XRE-family HTH domain
VAIGGAAETEGADHELDQILTGVGPRLRALRRQRGTTLADLSADTGISVSTLSRLESGQRRPNLELLLPLARAYGVRWTIWWARRRPGIPASTCGR